MLNDGHGFNKVYVATGYTDLRRGIDGLASIVKHQFHLDPFDRNTLFLFCGRRADRIKELLWEGLSAGFCYPRIFGRWGLILPTKPHSYAKNIRIKFYLSPQRRANSASSSGHSCSSVPVEITALPVSIA